MIVPIESASILTRVLRLFPLVVIGILHTGFAVAQSITTGADGVVAVPLNHPAALALLALAMAAIGYWALQHSKGLNGIPILLSGVILLAIWGTPSLRAQVLSQFTNPLGESLPIPVQTIEDSGLLQGFERADFQNAAGARLIILDIEEPEFGDCFPSGVTNPLPAPVPLTEGLCEINAALPAGATCSVDVDTRCREVLAQQPVTSLSALIPTLALSVNAPGADPALVGNPRIVRFENVGSVPAYGLQTSTTGFPTGTVITSNTCTGTLWPGATCDITVAPGGTASPDASSDPCTSAPGTEPVPGTVSITAVNAPSTDVNIVVLGYGCIHQGGFLFAVDDTTPSTLSIGGKVAALADEASAEWSTVLGVTGADSITNGQGNTAALASPYGQYPAAQACANQAAQGFTDWYLPAICELGRFVGLGADAGCGVTNPNLYSTLHTNNLGGFASDFYWSSSELSINPLFDAWQQVFANGAQLSASKSLVLRVRCVRSLTP